MSSPWTLIDDTCVPDGHLQAKHNGSHGPYNGLGHGGRCVRNEGDVLLDHDTVGRIYPQLQGVYFVDVPATRPLVSTTGAGRGREAQENTRKGTDEVKRPSSSLKAALSPFSAFIRRNMSKHLLLLPHKAMMLVPCWVREKRCVECDWRSHSANTLHLSFGCGLDFLFF